MSLEYRTCKTCKISRNINEFHINKPSKGGRLLVCKICCSEKWKGASGKYEDNKRFGGNRIFALNRDNWTCQKCGMTNEEHRIKFGRAISVDHIDGNGRHSKVKNNSLKNLITLCLPCHTKKDNARRLSQ